MRMLLTRVGWAPLAIIAVVITIALLALVLPLGTSTSPATNVTSPPAISGTSEARATDSPTTSSQAQIASPAPISPVATTSAGTGAGVAAGGSTVTRAGSGAGSSTSPSTSPSADARPSAAGSPPQVLADLPLPAEVTQQAAVQTATADGGARYIDMARRAAPGDLRPGTKWSAQVIPTEDGPAVMLIMPLSSPPSSQSALAAAKQRIADVVNTVFVNDPKAARLGVVGTYPNSAGQEVPAITLIVAKSASTRWGSVTPVELERVAQSFRVRPEFQK